MREPMGHLGRLLTIAAPLALASFALGQEVTDLPLQSEIVAEARPEIFTDGVTQEEFHRNLVALSARLSSEAPARITPIEIGITQDEAAELANAPFTGESPMKVGFVKPLDQVINFTGLGRAASRLKETDSFARGTISRTPDGGYVWAASFTSPGAAGLRLHLENMNLPANAELYFYSPLGEAYGPYTTAADLWTASVQGSTGILQLRIPGPVKPADLAGLSFRVTELGHIGPEFYGGLEGNTASFCQYNASCIENVNCTSDPATNNAENAVAKMLWVAGCCIYTCSGGLISDNDPSQGNYFLTANHCLSGNNAASNLEAFFGYQVSCGTSTCTATFTDPPTGLISGKTNGATVKATGSAGDFTLLQLSQNPPAGSVFLGWNNTAVAFTNGAVLHRISHPSGSPQAYSRQHVDTSAPTCQGWPRGNRIYSRDDVGGTEGGSSGSPVVNNSGQIVGQLTGACGFNLNDVCDADSNATVDGAFAFYYNSVAPFLNPGGGGCLPQGSSCTANSQCCSNSCKGPPGGKTCK